MRLTPDDFPLIVQHENIYGRTRSCPVLTAATAEIAVLAAGMMNRMDALVRKKSAEGFFVLGATEDDMLLCATF